MRRICGDLWQCHQCHCSVVMRTDVRLQSVQEWWFYNLKAKVAHVCQEICLGNKGQKILSQRVAKEKELPRKERHLYVHVSAEKKHWSNELLSRPSEQIR